jgi:hypothetical protein
MVWGGDGWQARVSSLDAIHIASARALGTSLGVGVAYDMRLLGAARAAGRPRSTADQG